MKKLVASAQGKITDWKLLETEKGKTLAHLQIQDDEQRVSSILVPGPAYKKWKTFLDEAYRQGQEIEIRGKIEDLGTHVLLVAEQVSAPNA